MPPPGSSAGNEYDARAMIVALEALRRQLRDSAAHVFANRDRAGGAAPAWAFAGAAGAAANPAGPNARRAQGVQDGGGGAGAAAAAIAARFAVVLGPLVAMSTILSQSNSGLSLFNKAIQVFATTLAPVFLPLFVLLAAGLLTVSDILWGKLLPRLGDWYNWILRVGIPTMEKFAAALDEAVTSLFRWVDRFTNPSQLVTDAAENPGQLMDDLLNNFFPGGRPFFLPKGGESPVPSLAPGARAAAQAVTAGGAGGGIPGQLGNILGGMAAAQADAAREQAKAGANPAGGFRENLKLVTASLLQSIGPKPSYQSLTEVGKAANLAAVGADPIDMKALVMTIQSIEKLLDAIANNTEPQAEPTFKGGEG